MVDSEDTFDGISALLASTVEERHEKPPMTIISTVNTSVVSEQAHGRPFRKHFSQKSIIDDVPKDFADFKLRTKPLEEENQQANMNSFFDYMDSLLAELDFMQSYIEDSPEDILKFVSTIAWLNRQFVMNTFLIKEGILSSDFNTLYCAAKKCDLFKIDHEQRTMKRKEKRKNNAPSTILRNRSKQMIEIEKYANECILCLEKLSKYLEEDGEIESCFLILDELQKFEEILFKRRRAKYPKIFYDKAMLFFKSKDIIKGEEMFCVAQQKAQTSPLFNESIEAIWCTNIGVYFQEDKNYIKALEYFKQALNIDKEQGKSDENEQVAIDYENISLLYGEIGEYDKAIINIKEALRINKLCFGDYDKNVSKNVATLSKLLLKSGKIKDSERYLRYALSINKNIYGSTSKELAESCFLLGRVLISLNKEEEGLNFYLQSLRIYEELNLVNDTKYADVYVELGRLYQKRHDFINSLSALQGGLKILNFNSVNVDMEKIATVHFIAGNVLKQMGNLNDAIFHINKCLEIRRRVLGKKRIVAHTLSTLGVCYADRREYETSLNLLKEALQMDIDILGDNHQDVATDLNNVSVLYADLGNLEEAINFMDQCINMRLKLFGKNHPSYGSCLNNKGCILRALGSINEAEQLLREAIQHGNICLGSDHIDVALRKNNLAEILQEKKEYEQAEELLYQVLNCWIDKLGSFHPKVGIAASNLALLLTDMGKVDEALEYQQQALDINTKSYGSNSGPVARDYNNLGKLLRANLKYEEAEVNILKSIAIREELLGNEHPYVAVSLQNLALLKLAQENLKEAYSIGKRVHSIFLNALGENHPWTKHCWAIWFENGKEAVIQLDPPKKHSAYETISFSDAVTRAATKYTLSVDFDFDSDDGPEF